MSKKRMVLNYKKCKRSICENGDMSLQSMAVREQLPTVAELMASPLAKYTTIAANDCRYGGTAE